MSAMRIQLLTSAAEWGGTEMHTLQLAQTLGDRGHDVTIVELARPAYERAAEAAGLRAKIVRSANPRNGARRGCVGWWRTLRQFDGDVCVLVKGFIEVGTWQLDLAARLRFPRYVTIEHLTGVMPPRTTGRHVWGMVPGVGLWWYRTIVARAARGWWPERIVCVSDSVRNELATRYRFSPDKLVTIPNGVNVDRFQRDRAAGRSLRRTWRIPEDAFVFGAVGRLSGMKRFQHALDAFARVCQATRRDVRFVLAGTGPLREALEDQVLRAGISHLVTFPGYTDRPEQVYSALDVFVMPSRNEGLPLALLEAMGCECCPVAASVGGVPEVLDDPSLGWLVPAEDDERFFGAMQAAAGLAASDLAAMGVRARARVVERFDARTQFAAIADVIEQPGAPGQVAR